MIFYKIEGLIMTETDPEQYEDRRSANIFRRNIAFKTEQFNNKLKYSTIFATEIYLNQFSAAAVVKSKQSIEKVVASYCKALEIEVGEIAFDEVTISEFKNLISSASRNDFVRDDDAIMARYHLDKLSGRGFRFMEFGENLIEKMDRKTITALAKKNLVSETLEPEIERIYKGSKNKKAEGHPVHYIVRSDDHDIRNGTYKSILSALYQNNRIENQRYCYLDFSPGCNYSENWYEALYKCSYGGSVVVRYFGDDESEDDRASGEVEILEMVAEMAKRYRNEVLTIVCFERECTKARDTFMEFLGNVSMIEIEEELASGKRAEEYLQMLAKLKHTKADQELLDRLVPEDKYLSNDLKEIFDDWYDAKLKRSVYPQYKDCKIAKYEVAKQKPKGNGYEELQKMIGLSDAKAVIEKALNFYKMQKLYGDMGINTERPAMHMVFTGNPGTAKTSVARLFAKIMKENGLLSRGHLIECGRADLVGKYVGWTAKIVQDKFKQAQGGVLFIDEAYSLATEKSGSFGEEAINTIVQEMENHRDELVVIFAGYPEQMEEFLDKNPGLRSRIAFHVPFADYNADELERIAELMCDNLGTTLTDDAKKKLTDVFESARQNSDFGNGRYVRNIIEMARMNQAGRILTMDMNNVTKKDLCTICEEDIESPVVKNSNKTRSIGFCA